MCELGNAQVSALNYHESALSFHSQTYCLSMLSKSERDLSS